MLEDMQGIIDSVGYNMDNRILDSEDFTRNDWWNTLNEIPIQGSTQYRTVYQMLRKQIEFSNPEFIVSNLTTNDKTYYLKKLYSVLEQMRKYLFIEQENTNIVRR